MKIKNKLYIKVIAVLFLFLSLGLFLYSCKKADKKVLFNLNGGNISGNTSNVEVLVKHGEKLQESQMPKPVKEKNRLAGWLVDGALFNSEAEKIEKDLTLTAKWIEQVSLNLPSDVKAEGIENLNSIDKDTNVTLEHIVPSGKTLKSFKINGEEKKSELASNKITFKITQDTKVEIEYETSVVEENYSLTLPAEVKANVADLTKIKKGTDVELEFIPQVGKTLKSFKINGEEKKDNLVANKITFKITQNTTVEVELENATNPLKAELDAEKDKVDALVQNGKIALTNDVTLENVKAKLEEVVDTTKVSVEVIEKEAGKKYEIKLTHKKDTTLTAVNEYEFEKVEDLTDLLNQIDEELEKIDNALVSNLLEIELEQSQNITAEKVKERLNNIVDDSVVNINVTEVEAGKKYNVELVHKENAKAKKNKVYEVKKTLPTFELTIDSDFEVLEPQSLNLSKVKQGTKVKVKVNVPEHKEIKSLSKNNIPVPMSEINNNEYEFEMTGNITLKVEFKVKQEYIQKLEEEFNKLSDVRVVAPDGNVQVEKVKEKLEELLDMSIVAKVEVVKKDENKFEITLTHKLSGEATFTKDLTVLPEVVKVTLDLQGKATYKGMDKPVITVYKKSKLTEDKLPKASELTYINSQDVFKSWTKDKDGNIPFEFDKEVESDTTIYAQYQTGDHVVTFQVDNAGVINRDKFHNRKITAVNDAVISDIFNELPILPGYKFLKWYDVETAKTFEFGKTKITKNTTIKAEFKEKSYLEFEKASETENIVRITGINDDAIEHVYVPEKIKVKGVEYEIVAVDRYAFFKNNKVKKITFLGNKLEEIHHSAFSYSSIEEVVLPNSLEVISDFAFYQSQLKRVVIPASVKTIGNKAFATGSLSDVVFENANYTSINKYQFDGSEWIKNGLKNEHHAMIVNGVLIAADDSFTRDMILPADVKKIGDWAFSGFDCENMVLNEGLEEISNYAFYKAKFGFNKAKLTLPKTLKYIGYRAFALTDESVIEKFDLSENVNLSYIRAEAFYKTAIKEIILPDGLKEIGDKAFYNSELLEKITIPSSLTKFGFKAVEKTKWYSQRLAESHFIVANDTLLDASKMTAADKIPNVKRIAKGAFINLKNIEELEIPESVEYIDSYAFYLNGDLKKVKIPGTIKKIEKRGFIFETYYTGGNKDPIHLDVMISDVDIAPTTWDNDWNQIREHESRKAGLYTFHWAYKNKVRFDLDGGNVSDEIKAQVLNKGEMASEPSAVPTKPGKVFVGWFLDGSVYDFTKPVVKSITLKAKYADVNPDYDLAYENNELVFVRLKNNTLKEFIVPENVEGATIKRIKKDAFKDNTSLEKVVIPDSVKAIEDDVFNGDTNLSDITFGTGVKEFGKDFIKGTKWLSEKRVSDKAVVINKVLVDAKNLEENAELPADIEKISKYAFAENTTTKILIIKEGVVEIEGNAFKGNTQIEKITLPSTMTLVRKDAFAMGRAGNVEIDAKLVSHQKPKTWEEGYDNGDGATLEFKWKQVTTHRINLIEGITLTDPTLFADSIVSGSNVEIAVAQKQYHAVSKFTVNGVNRLDDLKAGNYKLTINVTSDVTFELEYDLEGEVKDEFMNEFNKLQDKMGYVPEIGEDIKDIENHLLGFINTDIIEISVSKNSDKYDITFTSKKVSTHSKKKENIEFVALAKVNNPVEKATASAYVNGWFSSEKPEMAFDGNQYTKWCDNSSANKWVMGELKKPMFIGRISIAHAGVKEDNSLNTRKYTIEYEDEDGKWHEVAKIVDNKLAYTKHSFAGAVMKKIRLNVEQAEQSGNAAARIYEIELYAESETVKATFDLNGGNVSGNTANIVRTFPRHAILTEDMMPKAVLKNYVIKKWYVVEADEDVEFGKTALVGNYTIKAIWEVDPSIIDTLNENLNKILPTEFVTKDSPEILTKEEVINHIESKIDKTKVAVDARLLHDDIWEISIKHKDDNSIEVKKEVEIIKKKSDETVSVTYDLNGGMYDGGTDNIVYNIEKGSQIGADKILDSSKLSKDGMNFKSWTLENKEVDPLGYLLKKDVVFTAKWEAKPAGGADLRKSIKKASILKGTQNDVDFFNTWNIENTYDTNDDGTPKIDTAFAADADSDDMVELLYEFSTLVSIQKIKVAHIGAKDNFKKYNNLRKMEIFGSNDGENFEKIGEMNNPERDNESEINLTTVKPFKYIKFQTVLTEEYQGDEIDYMSFADIAFISA